MSLKLDVSLFRKSSHLEGCGLVVKTLTCEMWVRTVGRVGSHSFPGPTFSPKIPLNFHLHWRKYCFLANSRCEVGEPRRGCSLSLHDMVLIPMNQGCMEHPTPQIHCSRCLVCNKLVFLLMLCVLLRVTSDVTVRHVKWCMWLVHQIFWLSL